MRRRITLASLVEGNADLLRLAVPGKVKLDLELLADVPEVDVDVAQLQQAVLNLVVNAAEALPDGVGHIRIATGIALPEAAAGEHEIVPAQRPEQLHVGLTISDDGVGIPPHLIARVFEPFFTTKFTGRGLGLAAVQGIVRGHHGALMMRSSPGEGTAFRILLPVTFGAVAPSASPYDVARAQRASQAGVLAPDGPGPVLVVDDEEVLGRSIARILAHHGHPVEVVHGGAEALALVSATPDRFALIVLDLTMPDLDGVETLAALRRQVPGLRVVITSGYAETEVLTRFGAVRPDGFLQKPLDAASLMQAIRAALALDRASSAPTSNG